MNWVWPIAPAQEPVRPASEMSPRCRIFSAATSCCRPNLPRPRIGIGERRQRADDALHDLRIGRAPRRRRIPCPRSRRGCAGRRRSALSMRSSSAPMAGEHLAPVGDALLRDARRHVLPERRDEFRLVARLLQHLRIGRHAAEGRVVGRARDARRPARSARNPAPSGRSPHRRAPAPDRHKPRSESPQ